MFSIDAGDQAYILCGLFISKVVVGFEFWLKTIKRQTICSLLAILLIFLLYNLDNHPSTCVWDNKEILALFTLSFELNSKLFQFISWNCATTRFKLQPGCWVLQNAKRLLIFSPFNFYCYFYFATSIVLIRLFLDELYGVIKGMVKKKREKLWWHYCDDARHFLKKCKQDFKYEDLGLLRATCKKWANNI